MRTTCPSPQELALIGIGAGDLSCPPGVAEHIIGCPACQQFLERRVQEGLGSLPSDPAGLPAPDTLPHIAGFTIERELGRGAMAVVYLARREALSRPVALKLLPGGRRAGPKARRQWLREAEAASLVRHPNVVTLHEVGEADDCFYLVLEYIAGGTLADRINGPMAPARAARLTETIARAVHDIHRQNQLHLDLKPSNILLDGDPVAAWEAMIPKVADFGVACTVEPGAIDTGGKEPGGTPPYMAPEQITQARAAMSARADVYALGAILYHLLTGRPPHQGATVLDTLEQVRNQAPMPPRQLIPQIPRDLETIALKCLEKDPSARYSSAVALAEDLRSWLDGRPISARPVSPTGKLWRACRRRPVVAALAAALALTLSVGLVTVVLLWRHAEDERKRAEDKLHFADLVLSDVTAISGPASARLLVLPADDVAAVLQRTRSRILQIRTRDADDLTACQQLALVDLFLGSRFAAQKHLEESRALLAECLDNLQRLLERHPHDQTALRRRLNVYGILASMAAQERKSDEHLAHLERAVADGQECFRFKPDVELMYELVIYRCSLARALSQRGNDERARSVIQANVRMLDHALKDGANPRLAIWRTLVRLDLHQFKTGLPPAPRFRPDETDPLARVASPDTDKLDPDSWAELIARCLRSSPSAADIPDDCLSDFVDLLSERIAWQRSLDRIDEAERYAGRMHALARLLVARNRDRAAAHYALCESFKQMAKNAWQINDSPAIERNYKLALDEAHRAFVLDPLDARAAREVADLQRRLDVFLASKPESRG
jgi:eukaryotic-like serine/threonine-protein kinase